MLLGPYLLTLEDCMYQASHVNVDVFCLLQYPLCPLIHTKYPISTWLVWQWFSKGRYGRLGLSST